MFLNLYRPWKYLQNFPSFSAWTCMQKHKIAKPSKYFILNDLLRCQPQKNCDFQNPGKLTWTVLCTKISGYAPSVWNSHGILLFSGLIKQFQIGFCLFLTWCIQCTCNMIMRISSFFARITDKIFTGQYHQTLDNLSLDFGSKEKSQAKWK